MNAANQPVPVVMSGRLLERACARCCFERVLVDVHVSTVYLEDLASLVLVWCLRCNAFAYPMANPTPRRVAVTLWAQGSAEAAAMRARLGLPPLDGVGT